MPYIKQQNRDYFRHVLDPLHSSAIANAGELNYLFTEIINQYLATHTKNYQSFNDIVGALTCCKDEFSRRIIGPYETEKITENGDVYHE